MVTEARYFKARLFTRLKNGCAVLDIDFCSVDIELWHIILPFLQLILKTYAFLYQRLNKKCAQYI